MLEKHAKTDTGKGVASGFPLGVHKSSTSSISTVGSHFLASYFSIAFETGGDGRPPRLVLFQGQIVDAGVLVRTRVP